MPEIDRTTIAVLEAIEAALNTGKGKQLDERGRELLDPRPVAPPVGFKRQPSMVEHIRALVRSEALRQAAEAEGAESFEEADDFDVGEDYEPRTEYEAVFDPPPPPPPENQGPHPKDGESASSPALGRDESGSKKPPELASPPAANPPTSAPT